MDGVTATRLISQRQGGHPRTRVVFVSGTSGTSSAHGLFAISDCGSPNDAFFPSPAAHVLDEVELECYDAGGCDFISKPCRVEDIKACLERVCAIPRGTGNTGPARLSVMLDKPGLNGYSTRLNHHGRQQNE